MSINHLIENAKRGQIVQVEELIRSGLKDNQKDAVGNSALHWAAAGGYIEIATLLIRNAQSQVNLKNASGDTPLHKAAWKNQFEMSQFLLSNGADLDAANSEGQTPVALARNKELRNLLSPPIEVNEFDDDDDE
eukprot:TRINITY_DN726_c1_g2_i1.p1 TRINITY_DN726_c1_g2~~TRINITY_DN726_c1_g2_i1.p1  ORF type:complete len:134 (-),score=71.28 TRINITY_DN726_c1_g2_i1:83-484(-)